ncbi:MAG: glycosyltransferase family 2 protein [Patescibacteria group bacterium]
MENVNKKLIIGFITYGQATAKYLPYFLMSLKNQTFKDYIVYAIDNSREEDNENATYIKENYPEVNHKWAGKNLGFARAYNKLIKKAIELETEYFLVINPDIILETTAIEKMLEALDNNKDLGAVSPKLLKWDFKNNKKTDLIDTCGIKILPGLRFIDLGQGEVDKGQYESPEILGPSGACGIYRIEAFKKVAFTRVKKSIIKSRSTKSDRFEYFDELMFMYKEDCDLAYRLFLDGYKAKCVSEAIGYHDRTVQAKGGSNLEIARNRKNKTKQEKIWSFFNQQIIFIKYWELQSWQNVISMIRYQIKIFIYIIFFERFLLKEYYHLFKIKKNINIYKKAD